MRKSTTAAVATGAILAWAWTAGAAAQWGDPEEGDTGQWQPPAAEEEPAPAETPAEQPPPAEAPPPEEPPPAQPRTAPEEQPSWFQQEPEPPAAAGGEPQREAVEPASPRDTDHAAVVGALGISFFGVDAVEVDPGIEGRTSGETRLRAPTIGIRMWFSESVGLDVGVGLGVRATDVEEDRESSDETLLVAGEDGFFAINLHVGVPLALNTWEHFTMILLPEVAFGYGQGTLLTSTDPDEDIELSGYALDVRARFGGEVQFGFWNLPQLALQATVGLGLEFQSESASPVTGDLIERTESGWRIATRAADVFNGLIRATYYFN